MAQQKIKVIYADGHEVEVLTTPRAQVMAEEHCNGVRAERALLYTYYLAWASLNGAGKETLDFETWMNHITDVEDVEPKKADEDPTEPAPSAGTSSD